MLMQGISGPLVKKALWLPLAITSCCILHPASHQPIDQLSCKPGLIDKANFR